MKHRILFISTVFVFALSTAALVSSPTYAAQKDCGKELNDGYKQFLKDLRANNFKSGAASGSGKNAKALEVWLKKTHAKVVKHENAHKNASGKWAGKIVYKYYKWWNIPYAVAGCHIPKPGRPLKVTLEALLAPDEPSSMDLKTAEKVKNLIAKGKK